MVAKTRWAAKGKTMPPREPDDERATALNAGRGSSSPGAFDDDASDPGLPGIRPAERANKNAIELIEPGRALALAHFAAPSLGAGERLIRLAYRMGIPGSALSSPFGKPFAVAIVVLGIFAMVGWVAALLLPHVAAEKTASESA